MILSNLPKPANHHHTRGGRGMSVTAVGQIDGNGFGGGGGAGSKHLLEIEVVGLKRRLWAAESKQECRRWVSSRRATLLFQVVAAARRLLVGGARLCRGYVSTSSPTFENHVMPVDCVSRPIPR